MVGLDSAIVQHPNVWKASGHVDNFNDPTDGLPRDADPVSRRSRLDGDREGHAKERRPSTAIGVFSVPSGDDAVDLFVKRVDKFARKTGGGEVLPPEGFVAV